LIKVLVSINEDLLKNDRQNKTITIKNVIFSKTNLFLIKKLAQKLGAVFAKYRKSIAIYKAINNIKLLTEILSIKILMLVEEKINPLKFIKR